MSGCSFLPHISVPISPRKLGTQTAVQFLDFHFNVLLQALGVLGVNRSPEKQVTPALFKQKTSARRVLRCALGRGPCTALEGVGGNEHLQDEVSS